MTEIICPKTACLFIDDCGVCQREMIELEYDLCEPGLMDCTSFEED